MNTTPVPEPPPLALTVATSHKMVDELLSWKIDKTYNFEIPTTDGVANIKVTTRHSPRNVEEYWVLRQVDFSQVGENVEELHYKLIRYHTGSMTDVETCHWGYEKEYYTAIYQADIEPWRDNTVLDDNLAVFRVTRRYRYPFPLSNRVFFHAGYVSKRDQELLVVQLPLQPYGTNNDTVGRYKLVDRIRYDPKKKQLTWEFVSAVHPGGLVPDALMRVALPSIIARDVPAFFKWASKQD